MENDPTSPLLTRSELQETDHHDDLEQESLNDYQYQQLLRPSLSQVAEEIKQLYIIALPMIITGLLTYGKAAVSMYFMGKLGKDELAGGSLSIGVANITGYSVISGLAMGMDPISSQAYGAKQWSLLGHTLQRTIVILIAFSIPISLLWLSVEPLLLCSRQDPVISSIASTYLAFSIPDLFFQCIINPLKIYLRTQNITFPLMLSAAVALAVHATMNYYIVYHFGLGIQGIATAAAVSDFSLLLTLVLHLCMTGICRKSWKGWSLECFKELTPIFNVALPSCASVCLEWWWYECMIILAGLLSNATEAVATMGIIVQATALVYVFPSSMGEAVSTRVGNELGANQHVKARTASIVALSCATIMSFIALLFMTAVRKAWCRIFTNDAAILSLTAMSMPVVGLCELGNCPQTTVCGALRGSARPSLAVNINLGSFYGVGFPMAIVMGFGLKMGLLGIWMGLLSAQAVCALTMVIVLMRTDWIIQAERARELTGTIAVSTVVDEDAPSPGVTVGENAEDKDQQVT